MADKERALSEAEIGDGLGQLKGWEYSDGAIRRSYQTDGWRGSMLVANAIAFICESADHHADVTVTWPRVSVALSTHSAGGITPKDFEVAGLIEATLLWNPPVGSNLKGPAKPFVKG
jgi:4a-hydroxytetrahydrobiopterin dehydratase